ncbi:hypothetical protein [Natrinema saccharevitans]|uniref:hypothetical protein n=1 Tax=Natrinema saccharevitans TaxID=301967 RepID=UPI00096DE8B7|nr:hypothetical protein [Natrinema saccharevitans]
MPERYTLENFRKLLREPEYVLWELQRKIFQFRFGDGIDVMSKDWDNLILLDACRYDSFKSENTIDGKLTSVVSKGGSSWPFMQANFANRDLHDTVYVTANPHTGKLSDDVFHAVKMLHLEAWNDEYETVLPEDVLNAAIDAHEEYPNKRLIIHFMQPHRPFIGPTGRKLREEYNLGGYNRMLSYEESNGEREETDFTARVERGELSLPRIREAYRENVATAVEYAEKVSNALSGKTVVSADHGELLGDQFTRFTKPKYGHSWEHLKNKELYVVPWLEIKTNNRRTITADSPTEINRGSEAEVEDRLRSLGYR